jgi:soluble lytic murein transglycosylase-like protein
MRTFLLLFILFIVPAQTPKPAPIPQLKIKEVEKEVIEVKGINEFLFAVGHQESGNRYFIVNRYGYMGKYQFGKSTLKTLKIKVTKEAFLNSPDLQEYAMKQNLLYNKKKLQKYIDRFDGQTINGILVTESGLLAAAHLGGAGSVKKWFRTGKIKKDGNGVKITNYMQRFSGYDLYL